MDLFETPDTGLKSRREPNTPETVLSRVFGYTAFRPYQREIIGRVLNRQDTLAVMPTGGGKSLCCQIPALLFPGLTVMVSPLIALMQDQAAALQKRGVPTAVLSGGIGRDAYAYTVARIHSGHIKLLYLSPEALATARIRELLVSVPVDCITVDEAHCISEWGHDFRPDYRSIAQIRALLPRAVCLALTATATAQVRQDIVKNLSLRNPYIVVTGFDRTNIFLQVQQKTRPIMQILEFLREHQNESGIIYCFSRRQADELSAELAAAHVSVLPYHAGLSDDMRAQNQQRFLSGDVRVMTATVAFGMGIDKPDVRFVIHYDMPKSIEQYYQEIGRAGRDGRQAHALLLYSRADIRKVRYIMRDMDDERKAAAERLLQSMITYAESVACRRSILLAYFDSPAQTGAQAVPKERCCDICRQNMQQQTDITGMAALFTAAVYVTGQRYGTQYITEVLAGSQSRRICDNGHDACPVWGKGRAVAKENWKKLAQLLIAQGYITKSDDYGVLSLTKAGHEVCAGSRRVYTAESIARSLVPPPARRSESRRPGTQTDSSGAETAGSQGPETIRIAADLRLYRIQIAKQTAIPPYCIFSDKTLMELAARRPRTKDELAAVYGIGPAKLNKMGGDLLRIINGTDS